MKTYKAILIDVTSETVSEIEVQDSVEAFNKAIGSDCYTCGPRLENGDGVLVDDEGLLKLTPESKFFTFGNYPQPLVGNGLLLGSNPQTGDTRNVQSNVERIKRSVRFLNMAQVQMGCATGLW